MLSGPLFLAVILGSSAPDNQPMFAAVSSADEQRSGKLLQLDQDGQTQLATATGIVVVRDLVGLRRTRAALPQFPRGPVLITTSGDRIPGRIMGGDDQSLKFQPAFAEEEWEIPISAASVAWLTRPPAETPLDSSRYSWLIDRRNRDTLRFRNGDTASGTIDGFAASIKAFRFKPESGDSRTIAITEISAVAFNPSLTRPRKPKGPYARLVLRDGTRLAVAGMTASAEVLKGKTLFGRAVEIPLNELVACDIMGGKAAYLADLKPRKVEQAGFLGVAWPWVADRTARWAQFQLLTPDGNSYFDRGLGTHPRTVLTYDLDGKYRRFEALVGMDMVSGTRGSAEVRIRVDGKEQDLPDLRKLAAGPAIPVLVDVRGAKELTLSIDFGSAGDVQADVDWADARLIE